MAALAGVLVHAGWKLLPLRDFAPLWREHRGEAVILAATAIAIVVTNMFEGVLIGLLLAIAKTAWETSHVHLEITGLDAPSTEPIQVRALGNATFLRLPKLLDQLESLPHNREVTLDLTGLRHLDHACATALTGWETQRSKTTTNSPTPDNPAHAP